MLIKPTSIEKSIHFIQPEFDDENDKDMEMAIHI
jgi:hypothetical protein